jgi:hypothetical protein
MRRRNRNGLGLCKKSERTPPLSKLSGPSVVLWVMEARNRWLAVGLWQCTSKCVPSRLRRIVSSGKVSTSRRYAARSPRGLTPGCISACDLPPTFQSWFTITNLHVWLLTVRLRALPQPHGTNHIQGLIDHFFLDVEDRIRPFSNPSTPKPRPKQTFMHPHPSQTLPPPLRSTRNAAGHLTGSSNNRCRS